MDHSMEQFTGVTESNAMNPEKNVFKNVAEHSRIFDNKIAETHTFSPEEIKQAWQTREWKIGDTTIKAIGVIHAPETFLEFRTEIENAIQESDIVMNEFAPKAIGLYDTTSATRLKKIKSKFNEYYDLEQLRQAYIKFERPWNLGLFHHEVELLAAKHNKDMATANLRYSKSPRSIIARRLFVCLWSGTNRKKQTIVRIIEKSRFIYWCRRAWRSRFAWFH
jgi:hypothetical protein